MNLVRALLEQPFILPLSMTMLFLPIKIVWGKNRLDLQDIVLPDQVDLTPAQFQAIIPNARVDLSSSICTPLGLIGTDKALQRLFGFMLGSKSNPSLLIFEKLSPPPLAILAGHLGPKAIIKIPTGSWGKGLVVFSTSDQDQYDRAVRHASQASTLDYLIAERFVTHSEPKLSPDDTVKEYQVGTRYYCVYSPSSSELDIVLSRKDYALTPYSEDDCSFSSTICHSHGDQQIDTKFKIPEDPELDVADLRHHLGRLFDMTWPDFFMALFSQGHPLTHKISNFYFQKLLFLDVARGPDGKGFNYYQAKDLQIIRQLHPFLSEESLALLREHLGFLNVMIPSCRESSEEKSTAEFDEMIRCRDELIGFLGV